MRHNEIRWHQARDALRVVLGQSPANNPLGGSGGAADLRAEINKALSAKLSPGHATEFVKSLDYPVAWLN